MTPGNPPCTSAWARGRCTPQPWEAFARRWNLLSCGDAIEDAASALALAAPGTYRVGERARELRAGKLAAGSGVALPAPVEPMRPLDLDWCWQFLPKAFDALLEGQQSVWPGSDATQQSDQRIASISELRRVSSLFVKFEGLDASPSEALGRYHALCIALQTVLYQRDGPAGQLLFDDKGLVFHAAFGTPRSYHRDDASRAVSAALSIRKIADRHGLTCAIGIATGDGYFAAVGPRQRRELMLVGAPNNRAARLMGLADGAVLCDAATRHACGNAVRFEEAGALKLTGLGQVQQTYRPIALAQEQATSLLIGREQELAELMAAFAAVREGESRLVFLVGDAGIGKSFLVRNFLERIGSQAGVIAVARAQYGDRQSAYLGWRRILAELVGLGSEPAGEELLETLQRSVPDPESLRDRWPLLSALLGIDLDDTPATASLAAANRADATMRFVAELAHRLSRPPSVFVLEDGHWLDSSSWRLAAWLPAQLGSSLTLICLRGDEPCPEYGALVARMHGGKPFGDASHPVESSLLELFELDESAIHGLASKVLGDGPVSSTLGHRLWEVSRGNPLLAEEVLLSLRGDSLVTQRDGYWRAAAGLDDLERFSGIERVIAERIDRLDSSEQVVLKLACVVGTCFHKDELAALVEGFESTAPLTTVLLALQARHLVEPVSDPAGDLGSDPGSTPAQQWKFRHDRTREVIYAAIPGTLRRELHVAVANCLEQHPEWGQRCRADVLARHFHAAGVVPKVLLWADRAAEEALASGATREAVTLLQMCLEHEAELGGPDAMLKRLRWRRQLAGASLRLGELDQVKAAVESALALAGRSSEQGALARGSRLAFNLSKLAARQLRPAPRASAAPGLATAWALELARTHLLENMSRYYEHDLLGCLAAVVSALDWAERAGPSGELAEAYALVGNIVGLTRREKLAMRFFKQASEVAARLGDPSREAAALMTKGLYYVSFAQWPAAEECLDASQSLALSVGDSLTWCHAQQVRFWLNHYQGQRAAAEETASELSLRAQNSGNLQQEIWAMRNKALCALSRDAPQLARDYLRLALQTVRGKADKSELLQSTGCLALAYARTGQHVQGIEAAKATLAYLATVRRPTMHSAMEATSAITEVFLRGSERSPSGNDPSALGLGRKALEALEAHSSIFPTGQPRHAMWHGLDSWLRGDSHKAIQIWEKGLVVAERLGMRGEVALLEAELRSKRG